ncbi:hypothetical protein N665_0159s0006 [Sinapis alba]|nr:hypothetical protein N665_0159s0006 [Sinapis alba]
METDVKHNEKRYGKEISRFRVLGIMGRKKTTLIYFAVNQRDPMVVQTVKPFKPFEVLQMSGREPMQPATVEVQNRRHDSNPAIAHEMVDEKEPVQPKRMCFHPTEYKKQISSLQADERRWFEMHDQFKHFFHMTQEKHHKVMGMWMLLLPTVCMEKKKEAWFIVYGTPIRYSLREHPLISGLNCQRYPHNYEQLQGLDFARRQFPKGSRMAYEYVEDKLGKLEACPNRLNMCVLYFLSSILIGKRRTRDKAPSVEPFFVRVVNDLEMCKTFPLGRLSVDQNMRNIIRAMNHFGGVFSKVDEESKLERIFEEEEDHDVSDVILDEGLKNSVDKGIKVVIDKVDEMDKRLREEEAFVNEAKERSASTRDGEPQLVEQESEEGLQHPLRMVKLIGREASDDLNLTCVVERPFTKRKYI